MNPVAELVAAVDCGTNSTRLLIGDGRRTVERLMHITRMGEGVDATGHLSRQAMDRVLVVLRELPGGNGPARGDQVSA